ncbi:MAG: DegQ family serine endoprotease [Candidatus Loosdrechtia sp.]|uniref:DegQ family serine endoprotease n=1 Tax=Candidatus Loosdrechtia sp. TaxID=3101272 RepID=UPI003A73F252|nr:MAG: DegQ family serine endoprotease [Candidatus Jettenia sp. AMX2]
MVCKLKKRCFRSLLVLGVCVGLSMGAYHKPALYAESRKSDEADADAAALNTALHFEHVFENVVNQVKPAVVSITSVKTVRHGSQRQMPDDRFHRRIPRPDEERDPFRQFRDFFGDDFFDRFFRPRFPEKEFRIQGLGSGVILDANEGYIITNNHVVEGADELKITLGDRREFDGKVVGTDPQTDIAIIKIEGKDLPFAKLGDSDTIRVGQWAIAIGNPFGLTQTVSIGIISATGRTNIGVAQYEDMIQTDAAINPGNSGGPLVNIRGEVVGINTAIFTRSGGYQGIGFAIPVNMVKIIKRDLIDKGKVTRGWLGVVIQDIDPSLAKSFGVTVTEGVLVSDVQVNSPAKEAGFERGDIVIEYDGRAMRDVNHLRNVVAQTTVGKKVMVKVLRNGKEKELTVKIGEQPAELFAAGPGGVPLPGKEQRELGIVVQDITKEIAKNLGIEEEIGVIVSDVQPGSPAAESDIREGDIIKEVNREKVSNVQEFKRAIEAADREKGILMLVKRGDFSRYVIIKSKEK